MKQRSFRQVAFRQGTALLLGAGLAAVLLSAAQAGPCTAELTRLDKLVSDSKNANIGPTAPQTTSAQLHRQPTPGSVARADDRATAAVDAAIAKAHALDQQGNATECNAAVKEVRRLLGL